MINRRSFLIGLGATAALASMPVAPVGAINRLSRLSIAKGFNWAAIEELSCGSLDDDLRATKPVTYTLKRGEDTLWSVTLHPFAFYRWIARPDAAILVLPSAPLWLEVVPCHELTTIVIGYNVERNGDSPRKYFNETFRTRGDEVITHELHALNPEYERLIQGA